MHPEASNCGFATWIIMLVLPPQSKWRVGGFSCWYLYPSVIDPHLSTNDPDIAFEVFHPLLLYQSPLLIHLLPPIPVNSVNNNKPFLTSVALGSFFRSVCPVSGGSARSGFISIRLAWISLFKNNAAVEHPVTECGLHRYSIHQPKFWSSVGSQHVLPSLSRKREIF